MNISSVSVSLVEQEIEEREITFLGVVQRELAAVKGREAVALVTCLRALGEVHHGADDVGSHQHGCAAAEQPRPDAGHGGQEHLQHASKM